MTRAEAQARAERIWGHRAIASDPVAEGRDWWVEIPGQASVHFLDDNGHVTCGHDTCKLAEARVQ